MAIRIQRREFIATIGGAAAAWPLATRAQQPKMPAIGYLEPASQAEFSHLIPAFHNGLSETGYSEGQNVRIEYRWAEGQYDRLPTLAADLVRGNVTLIFATALISALAAKAATAIIPVVFVSGPDPVQLGLVASLNRPGGNLTGVTLFTSTVAAKRLELLHELLPSNPTFAFLVNPANTRAESDIQQMEIAARALGQPIVVLKAGTDGELLATFATLAQRQVRAVIVGGDPFFNSRAQQLVALATHHRIPAIYPLREFAAVGGLISYGSSISDAYRLAGTYAGRILKGAKPAELPILQPTKFELILNLKTATTLGIDVPAQLLARADEVIE
jgi:putative ABC transport system substrate-binding protein